MVTALAIAPVKGCRLTPVDAVDLTPSGPAGDRAFLVVGGDGGLLLTSRTPELLQVSPSWDGAVLSLGFPDGSSVSAAPEPGAAATTATYDGRLVQGRLVDGPLAEALSEHLGRRVRLLAREPDETGADDAPVTLMSEASLAAVGIPDGRRFRMTLTVDGVAAWEEHGWAGREVVAGDAVVRVVDPVPRCVVTTRDPGTGRRDAPTLRRLAELRGRRDVTFGVWCTVVVPGRVRVGDALVPGAGRG